MRLTPHPFDAAGAPVARRPRLAFLGLGWIGRHRLRAVAEDGSAEIVGLADPVPEALAEATDVAPGARAADGLDGLLAMEPDGIVIATPSALHAGQSIRALEAGAAVFCQKPLGRDAREATAVVEAAGNADRLLGVDLSYRHTAAVAALREALRAGRLGEVFAMDAVFHNAYGPDKPWFYDRALSGGGCLADLGVHLVDLGLWLLDFPALEHVEAQAWRAGRRLDAEALSRKAEDYVTATLSLAGGRALRLACSWRLHAGQDAVIRFEAFGAEGGAVIENRDGSFYDFATRLHRGTASEEVASPPDAWGGRAAVAWARALGRGARFDPSCRRLIDLARAIEAIYRAAGKG
ncbi:Gfo/Idh/MocA family protein [Amaricoccus solimangrovi]|uniref:Gfo/Idh/MocA family oxidoreductase n=1 Tax=Amaricoccus solimangrovi TaxID=2589815 RepID=A0A501WW76_9RHOB|nr:Gfo/Idh/MocA family oxidoreductase [Amaricoccus solimangrovi]TPE51647.1 Gfo/Idh/MocA family oxidoreductase [Amaricoccus solimangrovi]